MEKAMNVTWKIVLALVAVVTACVLPTGVSEVRAETYGDWEYALVGDQYIQITKYTGSDTEVTIPGTIDGKPVTEIGNYALQGCSVTTVTIPDGVTRIGNNAFSYCRSLTTITIPASVTRIGAEAFASCKSLTSIAIPDGVTVIESNAFGSCSGLISITIPNSVTSIEYEAFAACSSLTDITLPSGLTKLKESLFSDCRSLTSITIPNSVTEIEECEKGFGIHSGNGQA